MEAFQKGEPKALHQIYALYLRPLCFFTEQLIKNTLAAEDIAAECFIRAYQKKQDFSALSNLKAFLFIAAKNAALNYLRAEKRHNLVHQDIKQSVDGFTIDVEHAYIKAEAMQVIYQEIEKLPPQCKQVVQLSILEGKSAPEIAAQLNMAYQTVLNQKTKGIGLLRIALLKNELIAHSVLAYLLISFHK